MGTYRDTNLNKIIINKLSQAQYDELEEHSQINEDELYINKDAKLLGGETPHLYQTKYYISGSIDDIQCDITVTVFSSTNTILTTVQDIVDAKCVFNHGTIMNLGVEPILYFDVNNAFEADLFAVYYNSSNDIAEFNFANATNIEISQSQKQIF